MARQREEEAVIETTFRIAAPPETVWAAMMEVERWPEWTASMSKVERLDEGPLAVGSRVRIKQPRIPTTVWTVTELTPGRSFAWHAAGPGMTNDASHLIEPADGGSQVTLRVDQGGLLTKALAFWVGPLTRRYVAMEAEGLKRRCEGS